MSFPRMLCHEKKWHRRSTRGITATGTYRREASSTSGTLKRSPPAFYENNYISCPSVTVSRRYSLSTVWTEMDSCRLGVLSSNSCTLSANAKSYSKHSTKILLSCTAVFRFIFFFFAPDVIYNFERVLIICSRVPSSSNVILSASVLGSLDSVSAAFYLIFECFTLPKSNLEHRGHHSACLLDVSDIFRSHFRALWFNRSIEWLPLMLSLSNYTVHTTASHFSLVPGFF